MLQAFYRRKLPHLQRTAKPHFVTFCTHLRWKLPDEARSIALRSCLHDKDTKILLHAAVVMPDHVHLIFTPPVYSEKSEVNSLAEIMDGIKGASAHLINRELGRKGKVWQTEIVRSRVAVVGESGTEGRLRSGESCAVAIGWKVGGISMGLAQGIRQSVCAWQMGRAALDRTAEGGCPYATACFCFDLGITIPAERLGGPMAALPVPPPAPAPEPAPLSEAARLFDTFIAPSKTFTDLRRNASWWAPFIVLAIVAVAFAYVVDIKVGYHKVAQNQIEMSPRMSRQMDNAAPEDRALMIRRQAAGTRFVMYGFPVVTLIIFVIAAAIYLASYRFGAGADLTFKVALAVVIYAALPQIFRGLLVILSLLSGASTDSFNLQNPAATSVAYFLDPTSSRFFYGIGSALDIFRLWSLVLTAIGFTCVTKVKRGTSFAIVFGWYVLVTLVSAGFATMGS